MRQLNPGHGSLAADEVSDGSVSSDVLVVVNARIARADPAFGRNRRRFGYHEPRAAHGTRTEMDQMPVARKTVIGRILTHRCDGDPVAECNVAQLER
jgi:hypothetical protein